jgi:hypothetical protein
MFQKIMKINKDTVDDVICKHAKKNYEILCIVSYRKITKSDKFIDLKYTCSDLDVCHFCVAQNT